MFNWLSTPFAFRKVSVTVVEITRTPSMVHKGSDTTIQCRLEGASTAPTVSWSQNDGNQETTKTGNFADNVLVSTLDVKNVMKDLLYDCTFDVEGTTFVTEVLVSSELWFVSLVAMLHHSENCSGQSEVFLLFSLC